MDCNKIQPSKRIKTNAGLIPGVSYANFWIKYWKLGWTTLAEQSKF